MQMNELRRQDEPDLPRRGMVQPAAARCVRSWRNTRNPARGSRGICRAAGHNACRARRGGGALLIWHVMRRGRIIRERLSDPREVHLPENGPDDTDGRA